MSRELEKRRNEITKDLISVLKKLKESKKILDLHLRNWDLSRRGA